MTNQRETPVLRALQDLVAFLTYSRLDHQSGQDYDGGLLDKKMQRLRISIEDYGTNSVPFSQKTLDLMAECAALSRDIGLELKQTLITAEKSVALIKKRGKCLESYLKLDGS